MIEQCLQKLPHNKGTKEEIINLMKELFGLDLSKQQWEYKTFEQYLCKYFEKEKGYYKLVITNESQKLASKLTSFDHCTSLRDWVFYIML